MSNDYLVLIPCHNDCEKARRLKSRISSSTESKIVIGHNGCDKAKANLPWSNKARTINHFAQTIEEKYLIVLDADIHLTPGSFKAFEAEMKKGRLYGNAMIVFKDPKNGIALIDDNPGNNGQCWFCATSLLKKIPVPEDIITEDTAFAHLVKKSGVSVHIVTGAVAEVKMFEKTFKKAFRQQLRYVTGEFQMLFKGVIYYRGIAAFFLIFMHLLTIGVAVYSALPLGVIMMFVFFFVLFTCPRYSSLSKKFYWSPQQIIPIFTMTIFPYIALFNIVKKRWVW